MCGISRDDARALAVWLNEEREAAAGAGYGYDRAAGLYAFEVVGGDPLGLEESVVEAIVAAYSSDVGKPQTVSDISREHGLTRGTVQVVLKALGITHNSLPWTPERLRASSVPELREDAAELREMDVRREIERDRWRDVQADARRWRRFRASVVEPARAWFTEHAPRYDPPRLVASHRAREPTCVLFGLTDEHFGKYGGAYTGAPWDRETQWRTSRRVLDRLISRVGALGRPARIIIPIGSDGLHIDSVEGKTTAGTPQDVDGHPRELITEWIRFKVSQIDLLAQLAERVEGWLCPGNHDAMASIWLCAALEGHFAKNDRVTFRGLVDLNPVQADVFGETLIALYHGDRLSPVHLSQIIPRDHAALWGASRWRYLFTGHYHVDREVQMRSDLIVKRLPTICGTDDWHYQSGYRGRRSIQAHVMTERGGLVQTFDEPLLEED